ncbi:MAG: hypothetical protein U9N73_08775, partial [Candidatus Auribacterota bacterium]|nr:hypothetical protein [Candidatus Auribacterota bacterium]
MKNYKLRCWSIITSVVMLIGIVIVQRGWSGSGDDCIESGTPVVLRLVADCGKTYKYGQKITVEMQDPDFAASVSQKIILPSSSVDGTEKSYEFTGSAFVEYCVKVTDDYNVSVKDTYDALLLTITMKVPTPTPVATATPVTPTPATTPTPTPECEAEKKTYEEAQKAYLDARKELIK